jgi:hypothetical protein
MERKTKWGWLRDGKETKIGSGKERERRPRDRDTRNGKGGRGIEEHTSNARGRENDDGRMREKGVNDHTFRFV